MKTTLKQIPKQAVLGLSCTWSLRWIQPIVVRSPQEVSKGKNELSEWGALQQLGQEVEKNLILRS